MKKLLIGLIAIAMMIGLPVITQAMPGAKVLLTDNPRHRVMEVDPTTNAIVWQYGQTGVPGSGTNQLNYPNEAIPLTNGNILIADTYNGRIIEIDSATKAIVWTYTTKYPNNFKPVDIKRCVDYTGETPTNSLLITDGGIGMSRVIEVTYPGGAIIWELSSMSIGGTGDYIFWEAEKRSGIGTPTYLITCRSQTGKDSVMEVERGQYPNSGSVRWQYGYDPMNPGTSTLSDPHDANWTPCGNVLITNTDKQQVIEVQPTPPFGGNIVWGISSLNEHPYEAIRIENGNTLVVGAYGDDDKDGMYIVGTIGATAIWEFRPDLTYDWWYIGTSSNDIAFVDIEEKGIINIAKIEYQDMGHKPMKPTFVGVVVPIFQPEVVMYGTPTIVATKTVSPGGSQQPGTTLTYTIVCTNIGEGTATAVNVTDQIPDGTKLVIGSLVFTGTVLNESSVMVSHDGGGTYDSSYTEPMTHGRWTIPAMGPGESTTMEFKVVIQP